MVAIVNEDQVERAAALELEKMSRNTETGHIGDLVEAALVCLPFFKLMNFCMRLFGN